MFESGKTPNASFRVLETVVNDTSVDHEYSQAISEVVGIPLVLGTVCVLVSMVFFSVAIHNDWIEDLAPRAANRPKVVMKNALLRGIPEKYKNKIYVYPFAWIHWAYNLTYKECLAGIPGTGTRKNGSEGPLLKVNLDGVIWLKYQTLLFKIGLVVALLCSVVLIPINVSAECNPEIFGKGSCAYHSNQSGFVQTTIAHIPMKVRNDDVNTIVELSLDPTDILNSVLKRNQTVLTEPDGSVTVCDSYDYSNATSDDDVERFLIEDWGDEIIRMLNGEDSGGEDGDQNSGDPVQLNTLWVEGQTWRIMLTCFCCIVIYVYTMYLLWHEWIENVALRRAFFLEASHYGQRMIELNKLDLDFVKTKKPNDQNNSQREVTHPPHMTHPEIRETPPSIGLYSVLYQLPNSMVTYGTDGATSVERQLVATTRFFDMVIPAQPGFSSSVIAVTMIPKANLVAKAFIKWKNVEMRLQTLRFIRHLIAKAEEETKNKGATADSTEKVVEVVFSNSDGSSNNTEDSKIRSVQVTDDVDGDVEIMRLGTNKTADEEEVTPPQAEVFKYEDFDVKAYARSLGFSDEVDKVSMFVDGMGIEEFNVFAYNAAMLAGGPGLGHIPLKFLDVEKLKKRYEEIESELDDVHQELIDARVEVVKLDDADEALTLHDRLRNSIPFTEDLLKGSINSTDTNDEWRVAETEFSEALEMLYSDNKETNKEGRMLSGIKAFFHRVLIGPEISEFDPKYYGFEKEKEGTAFKTDIDHPAYAVITFASRHSAIIARQCLADGVASNNWMQVNDLPIYPLADAPANMWTYARGFMRPVTPTISYASKKLRKWIVFIFLVVFIGSYTAIINVLNNALWNPERYEQWGISEEILSTAIPTLSGLTQTLLFTVCPQIFKIVAYKSGEATSFESGDQQAMIYFWYFYLVVRYLGQLVVQSFNKLTVRADSNTSIETVVIEALTELASTTPTILGPFALTYIIFAATITWPLIYFLQVNNFLTSWFRLGVINRILKGGGPGMELAYRIYVDSGYVLSCMTTLAPVCPLIGPFAFLYFVLLAPMVRWLVVFAYRPRFDSGGDKWPKLHHIVITSLLLGQVLTMFTFLLKGNYVAGLFIGACIIPTLLFNSIVLEKFLKPFRDASLHYTGRIHKKDVEAREDKDPWREREEFRRWLVDCHKASYLPTWMSGGDKNLLTAEPALTVPIVKQSLHESAADHYNQDKQDMRKQLKRQEAQRGGSLHRQRYGI